MEDHSAHVALMDVWKLCIINAKHIYSTRLPVCYYDGLHLQGLKMCHITTSSILSTKNIFRWMMIGEMLAS